MTALTSLAALAEEIDRHVADANENARNAVASAIEAGVMLNRAKSLVPHGQWNDWLLAHVSVAPRTAQAYMRLAKAHPQLPHEMRNAVADLPLREALAAVATPPTAPSRQQAQHLPRRDDRDRAVGQLRSTTRAISATVRQVEIGVLKPQVAAKARAAMEKAIGELDRLAGCAGVADAAPPAYRGLPESRGVGIAYAMRAIACLKEIPLYDGLREDGFDEVAKWIDDNRATPEAITAAPTTAADYRAMRGEA